MLTPAYRLTGLHLLARAEGRHCNGYKLMGSRVVLGTRFHVALCETKHPHACRLGAC